MLKASCHSVSSTNTIPNHPTSPILYWRGVFSDQPIPDECKEVIQQMREGQYKSVHLKKLKGYRLYTARMNDSDRILFTSYEFNGVSYLLILEVIKNHDYQKAKFLKSGVFEQYLESNQETITKILEKDFEDLREEDCIKKIIPAKNGPTQYQEVIHYKQSFFTWGEAQQDLLKKPLPLLLSGVPGSGKTFIAFRFLLQYVQNNPNEKHDLLYLTRSELLVNEIRSLWHSSPEMMPHQSNVLFMTYADFVRQYDPAHQGREFVNEAEFTTWLSTQKWSGKSTLLYQEFRFISQFEPLDNYLQLNARQSLLTNQNEKVKSLELYRAYLQHLEKEKHIDLAFYSPRFNKQFALVLADEVQDLSGLQLKHIVRLAYHGQHLFCMDTNQGVSEIISNRPYLLELLQAPGQAQLIHYHLRQSYRIPPVIVEFANRILCLKNYILGGVSDKDEYYEIALEYFSSQVAHFEWINPEATSHSEKLAELRRCCESTDTAVLISHESQRSVAAELFKTPMIFTAKECKGLEFGTVIVFKPLNATFKEIDKLLPEDFTQYKPNGHRSKQRDEKNNLQFATTCNALFTAVTRSKGTLYVYTEEKHEHRHVLQCLKPRVLPAATNKMIPEKSSVDQWAAHAEKLKQNGNLQQANDIVRDKVKKAKNTPEKVQVDSKQAYLDGLLAEFTVNNLNQLITRKNADTYLYEIKASNGITLFDTLCRDYPKYLSVLASSPNFFPLLKKIVLANQKKVLREISFADLFAKATSNGLDCVFASLAATRAGVEIIDCLLEVRPSFSKEIEVGDDSIMADYFLVMGYEHDFGRYWLAQFFTENIALAGAVSAKMLYSKRLMQTLCQDLAGVTILHTILTANPLLTKFITKECLFESNGFADGTLMLTYFCSNQVGFKILVNVFSANPELYQAFTVKILMHCGWMGGKWLPPIFWLMSATNCGRNILLEIDKNSPVFSWLPGICLFKDPKETAVLQNARSAFEHLLIGCDGVTFLQRIFAKRPNLIAEITPEVLSRQRNIPTAPHSLQTTALSLMTYNSDGHRLFQDLMQHRSFLENISAATLCLTIDTPNMPVFHNASPLFFLALGLLDGLEKLFSVVPDLASRVTKEALFYKVQISIDHFSSSVFLWISQSTNGLNLLLKIFQASPHLLDQINNESLYAQRRSGIKERNKIVVTFSCLLVSEAGRTILKMIYDRKPELLRQMPPVLFVHEAPFLAVESMGCAILLKLLKANQSFATLIDHEKLFNTPLTRKAGSSDIFTFASLLNETEIGRDVLALILYANAISHPVEVDSPLYYMRFFNDDAVKRAINICDQSEAEYNLQK